MSAPNPSLTLNGVSRKSLASGGYRIGYSGHVPSGHTLWLGLPDLHNAMNVTGRPAHDLLDGANLPKFLSLIGNQKLWGQKDLGCCRCSLFVLNGNVVVAQSNQLPFAPPVRPLVCRPRLGMPTLGLGSSELDRLTYAGVDDHGNAGRFLHFPAIDNCYYFRNGTDSMFETDNKMRGFVCTTYIGAVWGIPVQKNGPMTWHGNTIAATAGAPFFCTDLGMKDKPVNEVKQFMLEHPRGTYLVGTHGHIALVVNGVVHDFTTKPRRGYNHRKITEWFPLSRTWTVGRPYLQF